MAETKRSREQKKEWAKLLYTREHLSQKEIAEKVAVSAVTVNKWVKDGAWDRLKQSMLLTRDTQLARLYMQLDELNTSILSREEGRRFADTKEADTISKLTNSIRTLETDASIADVVEVGKRLLGWLRTVSPEQAAGVARTLDDFIRDLLKR
ncbi:MAG: DDE transposase family protein [Tannerella sp.]|jgi:transcriptional regulator with XRE-family HTH domain|nr:DDE transposase family protein [Tannerella sp.]